MRNGTIDLPASRAGSEGESLNGYHCEVGEEVSVVSIDDENGSAEASIEDIPAEPAVVTKSLAKKEDFFSEIPLVRNSNTVQTFVVCIDTGSRKTKVGVLEIDQSGNAIGKPYLVLCDDSVVAYKLTTVPTYDEKTKKPNGGWEQIKTFLAFGADALRMKGLEKDVIVEYPISDGMSRDDIELLQAMIQNALKYVPGCESGVPDNLLNLDIIFGIPYGPHTKVYVDQVADIGINTLHANSVRVGVQPRFALLGKCPGEIIEGGNAMFDGGGSTGGFVVTSGLKVVKGGQVERGSGDIDELLVNRARMDYGILITSLEAERIKIKFSNEFSDVPVDQPFSKDEQQKGAYAKESIEVHGLSNGDKKSMSIVYSVREFDALTLPIRTEWMVMIDSVLAGIDPSLDQVRTDVLKKGIWFSGQGSMLRGIKESIHHAKLGVYHRANYPKFAVVQGMLIASGNLSIQEKVFTDSFEGNRSRLIPKPATRSWKFHLPFRAKA